MVPIYTGLLTSWKIHECTTRMFHPYMYMCLEMFQLMEPCILGSPLILTNSVRSLVVVIVPGTDCHLISGLLSVCLLGAARQPIERTTSGYSSSSTVVRCVYMYMAYTTTFHVYSSVKSATENSSYRCGRSSLNTMR